MLGHLLFVLGDSLSGCPTGLLSTSPSIGSASIYLGDGEGESGGQAPPRLAPSTSEACVPRPRTSVLAQHNTPSQTPSTLLQAVDHVYLNPLSDYSSAEEAYEVRYKPLAPHNYLLILKFPCILFLDRTRWRGAWSRGLPATRRHDMQALQILSSCDERKLARGRRTYRQTSRELP
jgi:hypothetical protein